MKTVEAQNKQSYGPVCSQNGTCSLFAAFVGFKRIYSSLQCRPRRRVRNMSWSEFSELVYTFTKTRGVSDQKREFVCFFAQGDEAKSTTRWNPVQAALPPSTA